MAIFTAINFLAMRLFNRVNSVITVWKVAIPILAIIVLFTQFKSKNFGAGGGFMPYGLQSVFSAMPTAGIVFAYLGFEQADQLAGEIKNPQKNLPRAIIIAILLAIAIYILLQVVFIGAIPHSEISGPKGWLGLSATNPIVIGPFAGLAGVVGFVWLANILRVDAFVSPFGTGLMYQTSTSRVGYGLARNRYFPTAFRWTDKNGVPWFSLLAAFALGLLFLLPFPSWNSLVGLVTSASRADVRGRAAVSERLPQAGAGRTAAVPDARRDRPGPAGVHLRLRDYLLLGLRHGLEAGHLRGGRATSSSARGWLYDKERPPLDWRSAQWLPVYLIGMGIISWQGRYCSSGAAGPGASCSATNRIPFWWDMAIVAVFALIIFYWAQAVRLSRAEMTDLVERQAGGEEEAKALGEVNPA